MPQEIGNMTHLWPLNYYFCNWLQRTIEAFLTIRNIQANPEKTTKPQSFRNARLNTRKPVQQAESRQTAKFKNLVPCGTDGRLLLSSFQLLVTLTLDWVIRHTIVHHSLSSIYISNFTKIGKTFCGRTNRRTYWRTFQTPSNRSTRSS